MLDVLSRLVARPELTDNITAAAIYDTIDRERCTLLIDEADNLELSAKGALRAVLNSGHRKGGTIRRGTGKQRRREAAVTFAKSYRDEDIIVILLGDIREIFNARGADRLPSKALVDALNAMEDAG